MVIRYKKHIIEVTAADPNSNSKWKPTCKILHEGVPTFSKELEWDLDYETPEEAERVGMLVSKKWIDQKFSTS